MSEAQKALLTEFSGASTNPEVALASQPKKKSTVFLVWDSGQFWELVRASLD